MKKLYSVCLLWMTFLFNAQAITHIITASGSSFTFSPDHIPNVVVGDTIRWQWGSGSHTTTSVSVPGGAATWDSPLNSGSPSFEYPVTVAGNYSYQCTPHAGMGMTGTFTAVLPAAKHVIIASNMVFTPRGLLNVAIGDTIRWEWAQGFHTTTSTTIPAGATAWDSPLFGTDTIYEYVVNVAGTYKYVCTPHVSMGMVGYFSTLSAITNTCDTLFCNDYDACTSDMCDTTLGCVFTGISCDDHNACTDDTCSTQAGCANTTINCNDNSVCTMDTCNSASGCNYTTVDCNDADACTADQCDSLLGCLNIPINCDDSDGCTTDTCSNGTCVNTTIACDDGDICTSDACANGTCQYLQIPGCANPCDTMTCSDGNLCTTDTCSNAACVYTAIICDDNDACTADTCNGGNCVFTAITCDDGDACTTDTCNGSCVFTTIVCNDTNSCTIDTCNNGACVFTPIICDDADTCTSDACNSGTCVFTPIVGCADPCEVLVCNDNDACTTDTCASANCVFTPIICDDADTCTSDACNSGTCVFTPIVGCTDPCEVLVCNDNDACTTDTCANANCVFTDIICNDGDSCTTDACANGICTFAQIPGCPVGIDELASINLRIYPNPVQDVLTIEAINGMLTSISIADITGKQLYNSGEIKTLQHVVQTADFAKGVYLLYVHSEKEQAVRKVQVE